MRNERKFYMIVNACVTAVISCAFIAFVFRLDCADNSCAVVADGSKRNCVCDFVAVQGYCGGV